jgi:hypothetical protein
VTRHRKARSGDLSGEPAKQKLKLDPGKLLQSIDSEQIVVSIDGKRRRMTKVEVEFRQLFEKAIKGNLDAGRLIASLAARYSAPEPEPEPVDHRETKFEVMPDEYRNKEQPRRSDRTASRPGRPKNLSAYDLFWKVAEEKTTCELEGVKVKMAYIEAFFRQMQLLASSNVRAARLINQLRLQFPRPPVTEEEIVYLITKEDTKL